MMRKICKVRANGQEFSANCGDLLLDAALMNGVDIPYDCRSGYCGTCRVNLVGGRVFGGAEDGSPNVVRACQCRVISDVAVEIEDVPETTTEQGEVVRLFRLAPDVMEVCIAMPQRAEYLPGQHYKVQFRGFPARCYSPTFPLEGSHDETVLRFHVKRVRNGRVSTALGRDIRVGHKVKLTGSLGMAFFRRERAGRVVLVAGGTGFAPMWSVALGALAERRDRQIVFIVGSRTLKSLYMIRALCKLAHFPGVTIVPVVAEPHGMSDAVRTGQPTDYMPALLSSDSVYTAGAPAMVTRVARLANMVGARCYTDPFEAQSSEPEQRSFLARATDWLGGESPPLVPDMTRSMQSLYDRGSV
ncbi:MAG TPA: 2Fe-2S iron-sulfur cluster-binding protein [Xanthobacteraceae bacterium]|nr:2Fe-2S iron-sulfur cluster-binding protein [Xanthobacteraceae bacterium]